MRVSAINLGEVVQTLGLDTGSPQVGAQEKNFNYDNLAIEYCVLFLV